MCTLTNRQDSRFVAISKGIANSATEKKENGVSRRQRHLNEVRRRTQVGKEDVVGTDKVARTARTGRWQPVEEFGGAAVVAKDVTAPSDPGAVRDVAPALGRVALQRRFRPLVDARRQLGHHHR